MNVAISGHVHIYLRTSVHKLTVFMSTYLGGYTKFYVCDFYLVLVCNIVLCVLSGNLIESQGVRRSD